MMMRIVVISVLLSVFPTGCYRSVGERDLQADGDAPGDVQDDSVEEPEMTVDAEACDPSSLILSPVSCEALHGPVDCERVRISEVRVLLFQDSSPVLDMTLPLVVDTIVVGPVTPGTYELAAISEKEDLAYLADIARLWPMYSYLPDCSQWNPPCEPRSITLRPSTTSIFSLVLSCFEIDCNDCCGS